MERSCGGDPHGLLHFLRGPVQQRHLASDVRAQHVVLLVRSADVFHLRSQQPQRQPAQRYRAIQPGQPDRFANTVRTPFSFPPLRALRRSCLCFISTLSNNQLNGTIPSTLSGIIGMRTLYVRRVAGLNCTSLRRSRLCISWLGSNKLSGTIPSSLGSLTGMQHMCVRRTADRQRTELRRPACALSYLDNNQLSGTIPSSLGSLTRLTSLCVHHAVFRPSQC